MAEWITTPEAARLSGYHVNYLRQIIRQGKIKAEKKGRDWWVNQDSLMEYLNEAQTIQDKRHGPQQHKTAS
jgi:excisionase family DNA binding protein